MTQNLIKRGQTYYWRARMPVNIVSSTKVNRICLSLKTQDYRTACRLTQRMNVLRDELSISVLSKRISKAELQSVFQDEVSIFEARMADIVSIVRKNDRSHDPQNLLEDFRYGWAYRLYSVFGNNATLKFIPGCPALDYLSRNQVPPVRVADIALTYRELRMDVRAVAVEARNILARINVDTNSLNISDVSSELLRARSDALLTFEGRYPAIDYAVLHETTDQAEVSSTGRVKQTSAVIDMPTSAASNYPNSLRDVVIDDAPSIAFQDRVLIGKAEAQAEERLSCNESFKTKEEIKDGDVSIDRWDGFVDDLCAAKKLEGWDQKTQDQARQTLKLFKGVLIEAEVTTIGGIKQQDLFSFRKLCSELYPHYGKGLKRDDPLPALQKLRLASSIKKKQGLNIGLSALTVRRHLSNIFLFEVLLRASGAPMIRFEYDGIRPKKPKKSSVRNTTYKPAPEEIKQLLDLPPFQAFKKQEGTNNPNTEYYHSGLFWCVLGLYYTACRRGEITKLDIDDVYTVEGIPILHFRFSDTKRVKNESSVRQTPIPPEMLRLGFLDYVAEIKRRGHDKVFPDLYGFSEHEVRDPGDRLYKRLRALINANSTDTENSTGQWKRLIHALRHGTNNQLRTSKVLSEDRENLLGHSSQSTNDSVYTDNASLSKLLEVMSNVPIISDDLQRLPIRIVKAEVDKAGQTKRGHGKHSKQQK